MMMVSEAALQPPCVLLSAMLNADATYPQPLACTSASSNVSRANQILLRGSCTVERASNGASLTHNPGLWRVVTRSFVGEQLPNAPPPRAPRVQCCCNTLLRPLGSWCLSPRRTAAHLRMALTTAATISNLVAMRSPSRMLPNAARFALRRKGALFGHCKLRPFAT